MNKVKLEFEVDVQKLAEEALLEQDGEINNQVRWKVKQEIQQLATDKLTAEMTQGIKIPEFVEKRSYRNGEEYLTSLADKIIAERLTELVEAACNKWLANSAQSIAYKIKTLAEAQIEPALNKLIASMLVVNTENVDAEMQALQDEIEETANRAYEDGLSTPR